MPKISVIMGIYNCADIMGTAIESIINQTFTDWEFIMCDDGSSDNTYEVALKYAERDPRIKVIKNEKNMRLAYSLNHCLKVAQGEYIARMDADDISLPQRFEKQVKYLDTHPEITVVASAAIIFDETGDKVIRGLGDEYPLRRVVNIGIPFIHPTTMMRKAALDKVGGYTVSPEMARAEDVDLWFKFRLEKYDGYILQEPLLRYHETTTDFKKRSVKTFLGVTKLQRKYFRLLKVPYRWRFLIYKPILSMLMPRWIVAWYHKLR